MTTSREITCPVCGHSDQVEKVSTIYLEGIRDKRLYALSRKLAPPSSGKATLTRPIHPDIIVIVFSCIIPFFLAGILRQQKSLFFPILALLICAYGFYLYKRKTIVAKYVHEQAVKREAQTRIERGIASWMRLYYCARDEGVFLPGKGELIPVDQMISYLLQTLPQPDAHKSTE